jgi:hypothetical protein
MTTRSVMMTTTLEGHHKRTAKELNDLHSCSPSSKYVVGSYVQSSRGLCSPYRTE